MSLPGIWVFIQSAVLKIGDIDIWDILSDGFAQVTTVTPRNKPMTISQTLPEAFKYIFFDRSVIFILKVPDGKHQRRGERASGGLTVWLFLIPWENTSHCLNF
jgi:hypothetical protein